MKRAGFTPFVLLFGSFLGLGAVQVPAAAQTFPAVCPDDDVISSLGSFIIWVEQPYRPMVSTLPGWNTPAPNHWTSPPMQDFSTTIGHSCVHADGDATDSGGTPVGTAATMVSDSDFAFVPTVGFTEGPAGTREVHTEIWKLKLEEPGCGFTLRAGTGSGVSPASFGEVEDNNPGADDFPAESFFNVFFELDIPLFGGTTLYNQASDPLVVVDDALDQLPPRVVYIHGETPAVPIYFKNGPEIGKRFGFLRLAGHGSNFACERQASPTCPDPAMSREKCQDSETLMAELDKAVEDGLLMDCPDCKDDGSDDAVDDGVDDGEDGDDGEDPCRIWIILVIILLVIVIILILIIIRRR